jgi:PAS domain S-box-containing protein
MKSQTPSRALPSVVARSVWQSILLGIAYYCLGQLGIALAAVHHSSTLIWLPAGIAIGFLHRFGYAALPGLIVASTLLALRLTDLPTSIGISFGNVITFALIVFLLKEWTVDLRFESWRDVRLFSITVAVGMFLSALNQTLWLCGSGVTSWRQFQEALTTYWFARVASVLLITPALVNCRWPQGCPSTELLISHAILSVVCVALFSGLLPNGPWMFAVVFVPFIVIFRTVVIDGIEPALFQILIVLGFVVNGIYHLQGPVHYLPPDVRLMATFGFLSVLALSTAITASVVGERATLEQRMRLGDANYRALVEDNPALICHFRAEGQLIFANETFRRFFGLHVGMTAGRNVFSVTGLQDETTFCTALTGLRVGGEVATVEHRVDTYIGKRWLRWSARPVKVSSGIGVEFHAVGLDITDEVKAEANRRAIEAAALQTQMLESVGLLTNGIAHEYNNLLTGVLANAELAEQMLPERSPAAPLLADVRASATRAADLTRQVLNYSARPGVATQIDLSELVRSVTDLISVAVPKRCGFTLELADGLPLVAGTESQFRQLLISLVTNAGEAVAVRGGRVVIRTRFLNYERGSRGFQIVECPMRSGPRVMIEVEDEGPGIDPAAMPRIFEAFYTTKTPGRGLGLPAAREIVRGLGGALGVCSAPELGTRVAVLLPVSDATPGVPSGTAHDDCRFCDTVRSERDTPRESELARPPHDRETAYADWSSAIRSRTRRPRIVGQYLA